MSKKPEIICLCGSSRFIEQFAVLGWEFEKQGLIALGLHLLPASYCNQRHPGRDVSSHLAEAEGVAVSMDELHLRKIDLADRIFVINIGGYIGESTAREIAYAELHKKKIGYLEDITDAASQERVDAARGKS